MRMRWRSESAPGSVVIDGGVRRSMSPAKVTARRGLRSLPKNFWTSVWHCPAWCWCPAPWTCRRWYSPVAMSFPTRLSSQPMQWSRNTTASSRAALPNPPQRHARRRVVQRVAELIGLPPSLVEQRNLRISEETFFVELLRDRGQILGRLEARVTGPMGASRSNAWEFVHPPFRSSPRSWPPTGAYGGDGPVCAEISSGRLPRKACQWRDYGDRRSLFGRQGSNWRLGQRRSTRQISAHGPNSRRRICLSSAVSITKPEPPIARQRLQGILDILRGMQRLLDIQ